MSSASQDDLTARARRVHEQLAAELARTKRANVLTGLVGAVALIALGAYFYFGYQMIDETTQPAQLVQVGQTLLEDNLPEARRSLEAKIVRSAPAWAEGLSQQARAAIPTGREQLERYALSQLDTSLKQGTVLTAEEFRKFLAQNRDRLRRDLQDLSTSPELAEESLAAMEAALAEQLEHDMRMQARELFAVLQALSEKLQRYKEGVNLSRVEQVERQQLLLARRLYHTDIGGPQTLRPLSAPAATAAPALPETGGGAITAPTERPTPSEPGLPEQEPAGADAEPEEPTPATDPATSERAAPAEARASP